MKIIPDDMAVTVSVLNEHKNAYSFVGDYVEITDKQWQEIFWSYYYDIIDHNRRMRFGEYLRNLIELARAK